VTPAHCPPSAARRLPGSGDRRAADFLRDARERERAGCIAEAVECYQAAVAEAERGADQRLLAEALRRLAVLRFQQSHAEEALQLCRRSCAIARGIPNDLLAAEALNTVGAIQLQTGALDEARHTLLDALTVERDSRELRARVEQNLGIVANIQGHLDDALRHYRASLAAYASLGDEFGCAITYHNLGMISADRGLWDEADRYFRQSLDFAVSTGDIRLQGLCLVNHAEVHVARQYYDEARANAEEALAIFDQLGARSDKADAYRVIGTVYRDTGRGALAESRLRAALDLAISTNDVLCEAETARELAILYQSMNRNQEALTLLNAAHRLFRRLDARVDLVNVSTKVEALQSTFLALVRDWGQSIESSDSYTHGHCERVASYAVAVARALGLDDHEQTTIRIGAYLHDVGKVKVPHEILNKPGRLTHEEFAVIQMHPVWGVELLATVEFPWDIKPMIRWHHEKHDGSGYPDRLQGDEIPTSAQIIGIVDVYDALTTTRSYRPSLSHASAMAEIERCRHWWRADVYEAFVAAVTAAREESAAAA
jgi:putative nucleotidyltransferase with HDIG domain